MSSKLTLASAAILTTALLGITTPTTQAQDCGFFSVGTKGFSVSLGFGHHNDYRWETRRHRVWHPATYRTIWVAPVYRTEYDCYGYPTRVLVTPGYNRRVETPGYWTYESVRVRVHRHRGHIHPDDRHLIRDDYRRDRRHERRDRRRDRDYRRHERRERKERRHEKKKHRRRDRSRHN